MPRRKIGQKTIDTIHEYASSSEVPMFEASYDALELGLTPTATKSVQNFVAMMEMLMIKKDIMTLSEFIEAVYEDTGYKSMLLEDATVEGRSRVENIEEFLSAAKDFEERYEENSLEDFLSHTSLLADVDKTDETEKECVTLLTIHSAKGLEYDTVFITGLEEGMFPMLRKDDNDDDLEEERRLFYVAVTRAKRMLYITYANERMVFGNHETRRKSRFIEEIPIECFEEYTPKSIVEKKLKSSEMNNLFGGNESYNNKNNKEIGSGHSYLEAKNNNLFKGAMNFGSDANNDSIKVESSPKLKSDKLAAGDKVMHKAWGIGTIVQLTGEGENQKAVIAFENKGIKNVMLSYAPIEKV
jgi:DNA helicase-2/ATP-dependent DNA helicase PcrA